MGTYPFYEKMGTYPFYAGTYPFYAYPFYARSRDRPGCLHARPRSGTCRNAPRPGRTRRKAGKIPARCAYASAASPSAAGSAAGLTGLAIGLRSNTAAKKPSVWCLCGSSFR